MSASTPEKEAQNEACKACRSVKRKCIHVDKGICTRCARLAIPCEYGQAKRGRKAGEPQTRRQRTRPSASAEPSGHDLHSHSSPEMVTPAMSPPLHAAPPPPIHDWLYRDLHAQNGQTPLMEQPHYPVASTSRLDPPPPPPQHLNPALPNFVLPPTSSVTSAPPPPASTPAPTPATGGFSLKKLLGTRTEEAPRHSLADAFAVEEDAQMRAPVAERVFEDIVSAGVCPLEAVDELFAFYYEHLNPMTSVLDPALHTKDWVRRHSPFLFSAIIAVATKVSQPSSYASSFKFCNALFGQAFEHGVNNVELVQALATFIFWIDTTDPSGARKLAYAIRSAMDCGMHLQAKRPLPTDEYRARLTLSGERTWFYLCIADHRFSNQRSLPCQIPISLRHDSITWILEHAHFPCPSEAGLAPLVALSRLLDLYNALIVGSDTGELPNRTLVAHLADASSTWAKHWSVEENAKTRAIKLQPAQLSLVRFYGKVFRFQLDELYLLLAISSPMDPSTSSNSLAFDPMNSPVLIFGRCVRSALDVLECFREELRVLKYCFDSIFIGAASCGIWLVQNIKGAAPPDRQSILLALRSTQSSASEASSGPQTMPAYMARLTAHLLKKAMSLVSPSSSDEASGAEGSRQVAASPGSGFELQWSGGGGALSGFEGWAASGGDVAGGGGVSGVGASAMMSNQLQSDYLGNNPFFGNMLKPLQSFGDELVYPADDDLLWQSLFPFYATNTAS